MILWHGQRWSKSDADKGWLAFYDERVRVPLVTHPLSRQNNGSWSTPPVNLGQGFEAKV